ncbi:MAG: hypothetical protein HQL29_00895 [Candidatus Omnitrophica bacterium]|nr:hypothetical protein [Candidatus Omnitrophota bacterium]
MSLSFKQPQKHVSDRRREQKRQSDALNKGTHKHEVKDVYEKFYRDQVSSLYREVMKSR